MKNSDGEVEQYFSTHALATDKIDAIEMTDSTIFQELEYKQFYVSQDGEYSFETKMINEVDQFRLIIIHQDQIEQIASYFNTPIEAEKSANGDILYKYQWHLSNTSQSQEVITNAVAGNDINVTSVWGDGIYGNGVTVAVLDEGVEVGHPDLRDNIDINRSWNYNTNSRDTTPTNADYAHGTAVAGIIAAVKDNGIGGTGVAPKAKIISYNVIEAQDITSFPLVLKSLIRDEDIVDIYNNSWGLVLSGEYDNQDNTCTNLTLYNNDLTKAEDNLYYMFANQLSSGVKEGRDNKGAIYVKSAGNSGQCAYSGRYESYSNANFYPEQVERYMIVVGASGANGEAASYTTPGTNVLVNAPGGGTQLPYLVPNEPMIVTTDLSGKFMGYDYQMKNSGIDFTFDVGGNENYDYTDRMNGTSSSGPIVSGVVALMLEANPNLTWRDVRYILATTATKNPDTSHYISNDAGLSFSSVYGFGRVDATAAVNKAIEFRNNPSQQVSTEVSDTLEASSVDSTLVAEYATASTTTSANKSLVVEYVNVEFSIEESSSTVYSQATNNKLKVSIISPRGTTSTLITAPNYLSSDQEYTNMRVGTNQFLDEISHNGDTWTIVVEEVSEGNPKTSSADYRSFKLSNPKIEIYGH
jgi:subtilisin family serine protease